jgi:hypothetical protein
MCARLVVVLTLTSWSVFACGDMADQEGVPNVRRVGPAGATLTLGAATVEIPAGALAQTVEVSLIEAVGAPEGALETAYALLPADLVFAVPATLRLAYDAATLPAGVPVRSLLAGTPSDGTWTLLGQSSVDTTAGEVVGLVDGALTFGLVSSRCYHPNACPVAKLDLLFVVDDSSSMCQEQLRLADQVQRFVAELQQRPNLDLRVAVTTTDVRSDGFKGRFRNQPATQFGPACQLQEVVPCFDDATCRQRFPGSEENWTCSWTDHSRVVMQNDNGSVNSSCQYACASDAECEAAAGPGYSCNARESWSACIPVPAVGDCPADPPTVLDPSNVGLLRCLIQVGADGTPDKNLEGGLKAGWLALHPEPEGVTDLCDSTHPNLCELHAHEVPARLRALDGEIAQAAPGATRDALVACRARLAVCRPPIAADQPDFQRPDAWLAVVFVSDENDCSDRDENPLSLNDTKLCATLSDHLLPIDDLVARYRQLKAKPSRLLVATIAGDVLVRGTSSCLVPDFCTATLHDPACQCYAAGTSNPACPKLLSDGDHVAMCTADCASAPDWAARRTSWCLADPPTDWCSDAAEPAPADDCLLLDARIAAYDQKLALIDPLLDADPVSLSPDALACVAKYNTFAEERATLVAARAGCDGVLAEELAYRRGCLDECFGKKAKPDRRCSLVVPEACGCYAPTAFATAACQAQLRDEPTYRKACLRACFEAAKEVSAVQPNTAPHVCQSADGIADLGSRYLEFVEAFGADGRSLNICSGDRLGDDLVRVGTTIRHRIEGEW